MSIVLKGIDLPETNEIRMVAINSNGEVFFNTVKDGIPNKTKTSQAIQIPKEHGRLIDEREVKKAQFIINDQWGSYPVISLGNLNCVPTILESEETDEHDIEGD